MTSTVAGAPTIQGGGVVRRALSGRLAHVVLAVAVYPALLLTQRGQVAADSKQLLFVDPSRFLSGAPYLWDPSTGLGTVTHQNLGYLLPMGPWFWVTHQVGIPMWVSQRLWLGTILFLAGAGVLFLARTLGWSGWGPITASLAYALSPFVLQYATHLSILLLPYAALGWLVGYTIRAVHDGSWRWPAWFAIAVALSGSVNATAIACVLLGPAIVLVLLVVRDPAQWPRIVSTAARISVLALAVSVWWMVALAIESRYSLDVLDFTESLRTVTLASSAPELLRGLGYWFFYGRDNLHPYLDAGHSLMSSWLLPVSFLPALGAIVAAVVVRWRYRAIFVALVILGLVVAAGAHPFNDPSPFGSLFKSILDNVDAARALRSITRVTPVLILGLAVLLGAGVTAALATRRRGGRVVAVAALAAVLLTAVPIWRGQAISSTRVRPETIPSYWRAATSALDASGDRTRVLELPGIDFAAYTWGFAGDSVTRGLMDRPTLAREVVPYGTAGSVDLLAALDHRLQEGTLDVRALPAVARLLAASDVLVRRDLEYQRYNTPSPEALDRAFADLPDGVHRAAAFGPGSPPALEVLHVDGTPSIVRATSTEMPVIVAGSGDGLVDAAEAGVLPENRLVVYAASLNGHGRDTRRLLDDHAALVVTDTNRRRALRAKSLSQNDGYTERAGEQPLRTDPEDARLDLFPNSDDRDRSVTIVRGPTARATSYGNPVTLEPTQRPQLAVDGDPATAWTTGEFFNVVGERIEVDARQSVDTGHVRLLQPPGGNRVITRVRLTFDGDRAVDVDLRRASLAGKGEVVRFPRRTFRKLGVEILDTDPGPRANNDKLSGVGFAEIAIPGVGPAQELVRTPTDLLDALGRASDSHSLTFLLSRLRAQAGATAPEARLARVIEVPSARSFTLTGTARPLAGGSASTASCRSDLLTVDGRPLPLEVSAAASDAARTLSACDGGPLVLGAGRHELITAPGAVTGLDVDRLVLQSEAGGGPAPAGAPIVAAGPTPGVKVERKSPTSIDVTVRGARAPFWLVLGESNSNGWKATLNGRDLGTPLLVDGTSNGWYVDPGASSHLSGSFSWTPQRWVWIGLAISAAALVVCLALALRRRTAWVADPGASAPAFSSPFELGAAVALTRTTVVAVAIVTLVAIVVTGPLTGVLVGAATIAALRLRRGHLLLGGLACALTVGAAAFITLREGIERFPADFPWPASFDAVHAIALAGVLLLAVDVVVERLRRAHSSANGDTT